MNKASNNFAVIDIGTNAVKCIAFIDGKQVDFFRNKVLTQSGNSNLNADEIEGHIKQFIEEVKEKNIQQDKIYIAATEGFRKSSNQEEIKQRIKKKTGKIIHKISPQREAYLSALGGLSYIQSSFKGSPTDVIFIESGGGSTEISLIDATNHSVLSIEQTVSIPLGSKDQIKPEIISKLMTPLAAKINQKSQRGAEFAIVINSSTASRILARRYNKEKYNPQAVAQKQYSMQTKNFIKKLDEIRSMSKNEIETQFYLHNKNSDSFLNQGYILQEILNKISKHTEKAQISTTIGGLKHGLAMEIAQAQNNEKQNKQEKQSKLAENTPPTSKFMTPEEYIAKIKNKETKRKSQSADGSSSSSNFMTPEEYIAKIKKSKSTNNTPSTPKFMTPAEYIAKIKKSKSRN